jgi:chromosome segregation ATPase
MVLEKVNREVFAPKGLVLEILKDDEVMRRLNTTAKSLDPLERLQELGLFVENLSFDVGPVIRHSNVIDRISAKQAAMKQESKEKKKHEKETKRTKKREKAAEKYSRPVDSIDEQWNSDTESLVEIEAKLAKLESKIVDINAQADAKLGEGSVKKVSEIEKRRQKDLAEVEKDRRKLQEKYEKAMARLQKKADKREDKGEKKVAKLQWIIIHTA